MRNPYFIDEPAALAVSGGRTSMYMLLNKAEANIEAVGKGTFGVGIYPNKSKNPAAKKV